MFQIPVSIRFVLSGIALSLLPLAFLNAQAPGVSASTQQPEKSSSAQDTGTDQAENDSLPSVPPAVQRPVQGSVQGPTPVPEMDPEIRKEINAIRARLGGGVAEHLKDLPQLNDLFGQIIPPGSTEEPGATERAEELKFSQTTTSEAGAPSETNTGRSLTPGSPLLDDPNQSYLQSMFDEQLQTLAGVGLIEVDGAGLDGTSEDVMESIGIAAVSDRFEPEDQVFRIRQVARDLDVAAADLEECGQYSIADQIRTRAQELRLKVRNR